MEAYNLFLRGRDRLSHLTRSSNIEARKLLERAVTINPDFAAALAYIAATHVIEYANDWRKAPSGLSKPV